MTVKNMDINKFTKDGLFLMLALDHRTSFKKLMNPQNPDSVTDEQVINLKSEIVRSLLDQFSGLLIDETFGLAAYPKHDKPFLLPLEKSGYTEEIGERITEIEFSVDHLMSLGASGAKVLFYFNPEVKSATKQLETAKIVVSECKEKNFPIFLEIVTYQPDGKDYTQDATLILNSLRSFLDNRIVPDVFKLEYSGSFEACQKITQLLGGTPWILLTNPNPYDVFQDYLEEAIKGGAKGFLAGRALWHEVCKLNGLEREEFLKTTLPKRFRILADIASS